MALAMLTDLVTKAAASNLKATGSNPSPESYLGDYLAPQQSALPAIETAQARNCKISSPGMLRNRQLRERPIRLSRCLKQLRNRHDRRKLVDGT